MTKDEQARVRDALLQQLYTSVLHATLAATARGALAPDAATAAGVCANLQPRDAVLLPGNAAASLRLLNTAAQHGRVYTLPPVEAQAVSYALAITAASRSTSGARHAEQSAVCLVLPKAAPVAPLAVGRRRGFPASWHALADYAAKHALPVLFVSLNAAPVQGPADPRAPAPLYPTIPVDAQDALAVYRVASECLARARAGGGPSHLQAVRLRETVPPLERLEAALRRRGCFSKAWQRSVERAQIAALTR